jgi:hypothetical protein
MPEGELACFQNLLYVSLHGLMELDELTPRKRVAFVPFGKKAKV